MHLKIYYYLQMTIKVASDSVYLESDIWGSQKITVPRDDAIQESDKSQKGYQVGDDVGHQEDGVRCSLRSCVQSVGFSSTSNLMGNQRCGNREKNGAMYSSNDPYPLGTLMSLAVVCDFSVSGQSNLDRASAAGAAITDADRSCEALIPKLMYAANTDPGRLG